MCPCPPAISPITFNAKAIEAINNRKTPIANWYLDITRLGKYWGAEHAYHHTASSPLVYGLAEGLRIIYEEGLPARFDRHLKNARLLWQGLEGLGLELIRPSRLPPADPHHRAHPGWSG